jgi:hypothetical protein
MMQRASNATPIHCLRGDDSVVIATASPMLKCLFRLETASLHKRVGLVTREVIVDCGHCGSCRKRPGHKHTDDDRQDFPFCPSYPSHSPTNYSSLSEGPRYVLYFGKRHYVGTLRNHEVLSQEMLNQAPSPRVDRWIGSRPLS